MSEAERRQHNVEQQVELYGAPMSSVIGWATTVLGISQAELAQVIGLSAPMLSHLVAARRVKIGNPAVGERLNRVRQLTGAVEQGRVDRAEVGDRLTDIRQAADTWLSTAGPSGGTVPETEVRDEAPRAVAAVQELFRATASAGDWLGAADRVAGEFPAVADVLRIYGAGRTDQAVAHWRNLSK